MEIPDDLLCLFSARVERRGGAAVVEIPHDELEQGDLSVGSVYRIAVLSGVGPTEESEGGPSAEGPRREPPVAEGEVRTVEIEGIGDQGDGIAKVDRGYVVIVPDTAVGDEVTVEIESIYPNFAMARAIDGDGDGDGDAGGEARGADHRDGGSTAEQGPGSRFGFDAGGDDR